jgi:hypothetical protein
VINVILARLPLAQDKVIALNAFQVRQRFTVIPDDANWVLGLRGLLAYI